MSVRPGSLVPSRWSPLRRQVELLLADGAWHETDQLYFQVERFIDPRIAAKSFARTYEHARAMRLARGLVDEVAPASRVLATDQERALAQGRRRAYWDCIRMLRRYGHAETQTWGGRRRVRLSPRADQGA